MEKQLSGKRLWRIAGAIRDQIQTAKANRHRQMQEQVRNLLANLVELESVRRRLDLCLARGWTVAAGALSDQALRIFRGLSCTSQEAEQILAKPQPSIPNVREIVEELLQVEEEFEELRYYPEDDTLSVVTDKIELEGVYLGDFEVQLHIRAIGDWNFRNVYQVVALDPHPAQQNEAVTHPHISEDRLCAGDAGAAIETALAEGRVCDFFMLARSVLTTYNRDSAYVTLEAWEGVACHECGGTMGEDDTYYCTTCDYEFCGECSSCCRRCDETTCLGCLETCAVCEEHFCSSCMAQCPECGERLCRTCREEGRCPCLNEEPENQEEEDHDNDSSRIEDASEGGEADHTGLSGGFAETSSAGGSAADAENAPEGCPPVLADRLGETPVLP